jgi:hypothetical protein
MRRASGRPPKLTEFDDATVRAARRGLHEIARELHLPRARQAAPTARDRNRTVLQPRPLDLAVLALELSQVMEVLAAECVERARELDGATWEDVGAALGVTMQSAHARFGARARGRV